MARILKRRRSERGGTDSADHKQSRDGHRQRKCISDDKNPVSIASNDCRAKPVCQPVSPICKDEQEQRDGKLAFPSSRCSRDESDDVRVETSMQTYTAFLHLQQEPDGILMAEFKTFVLFHKSVAHLS